MHIFHEAIHHKLPLPLTHTPLQTYYHFLQCFTQIVYRVLEQIRIAMPHNALPKSLPRITALARRLRSFATIAGHAYALSRMDVLSLIHRINTLEEVEMEFEGIFSQVHVAHTQIRLITGCTEVAIPIDNDNHNSNNSNSNNTKNVVLSHLA